MEDNIVEKFPEEACGLIAGVANISRQVIPVTNILHDAHHFRLDPQEQLDAMILADEKGWEILAVYHSHPDGINVPSPTDLAELTYPGIIYLIWYQEAGIWKCCGYLMESSSAYKEVPITISTG